MAAVAKEQMQIELTAEDKTAVAFNQLKSHLMETQNRLKGIQSAIGAGTGGIAGIFTGMTGAAGAAGAAFALVTTGIDVAKTAVEQFYKAMAVPARPTEDMLADQARLIELIKKGYEEGATAADKFAASVSAVTRAQEDANRRQLQARMVEASNALVYAGPLGSIDPTGGGGGFEVAQQFAAFAEPIKAFQAALATGNPNVKQLREEVAKLAEANPSLNELRDRLLGLTDPLDKLDPAKVRDLREELNRLAESGAQTGFQSNYRKLLELAPKANEAEIKMLKELDILKLRGAALQDLEKQGIGPGSKEHAATIRLTSAAIAELNEKNKEAADRYQTATQSVRDNIVELDFQAAASGRAGAGAAELKTKHDLLRAAMRAGREETPQLRAEIDALAASFARASQNASLAKLRGDIGFERDQWGRSDIDQTVASRLRAAGQDVDLSSAEAQLIRFNEQFKQFREVSTDFAMGFARDMRSGLMAGKDAWDAFANAGMNALNRLSDKLFDMAAQGFINQLVGAFGQAMAPAGTGLGGGAPGAFGFYQFGGQNVPLAVASYHSGGVVGVDGTTRFVDAAGGEPGGFGEVLS